LAIRATADPWTLLTRIARINIVLGIFICSRVLYDLRELLDVYGWRSFFHDTVLTIDFALGNLCIFSGGLLLRRRSSSILMTVATGGAIYANALFGLILSFPVFFNSLSDLSLADRDTLAASAASASHSVQSAVLMLYWTGVLWILLGDLSKRDLEGVYQSCRRQALMTWCATAASSMTTVQILLRLFGR